jgi:hypothetical protein
MRRDPSAPLLVVLVLAALSTACSLQADLGITTRVKSLRNSDHSVINAAQIQVTATPFDQRAAPLLSQLLAEMPRPCGPNDLPPAPVRKLYQEPVAQPAPGTPSFSL